MLTLITHISIAMGVDGHRADIVMHKTACTIAAWEKRHEVTRDDVRRAAEIALPHRRRRDPFTRVDQHRRIYRAPGKPHPGSDSVPMTPSPTCT